MHACMHGGCGVGVRDPRLCRGFFDVTAGQDAVVFVLTRHGLEALGRFDENIYPAYFEDHDMDLR